MFECRNFISDCCVMLTQIDQAFACAVECFIQPLKCQELEESLDLGQVVGIFGVDQQVHVHGALLRAHVEAHLNVRKEQGNPRRPSGVFVFVEFLIRVGHVIVGDADRLYLGQLVFECLDIGVPIPLELVVEDGARRMDMRLPPAPLRPATDIKHRGIIPPKFDFVTKNHFFLDLVRNSPNDMGGDKGVKARAFWLCGGRVLFSGAGLRALSGAGIRRKDKICAVVRS